MLDNIEKTILIGGNLLNMGEDVKLFLKRANRHGLISGATGTGKTVSLQILAEQFSKQGIPVFASDVKGDLAGIAFPGKNNQKIQERLDHIKINNRSPKGFPTVFWDLNGERGHPIRTTVSEMGPILLSRLMNLSDTQDALLHVLFKIADDNGRLLIDLDDIDAMLGYMEEYAKILIKKYGNMASTSIGAIRRGILILKESGGDIFFGEPFLQLEDLMKKDLSGNGVINILDAKKLMVDSRLYSTFLLRLISELFENLPEVGDLDKPKLVFFFDEAHLLFRDAPKILLEKIEQVVKLIRSKGVGIYFITQSPIDIPDIIRSQLGNRIQHALRAFTPKDQKAIKIISETFRQNDEFNIEDSLVDMSVGIGLISCLDEKGKPQIVKKTLIRPPESRMGAITIEERKKIINRSSLLGKYDTMIDRRSVDEIIDEINGGQNTDSNISIDKNLDNNIKNMQKNKNNRNGVNYKDLQYGNKLRTQKKIKYIKNLLFGTNKRQGIIEIMGKSFARKSSTDITGQIIRGILGSMMK